MDATTQQQRNLTALFSLDTLNNYRINDLFIECNVAALRDDLRYWYKIIERLYSEVYPYLTQKEKDSMKTILGNILSPLNDWCKMQTNTDPYKPDDNTAYNKTVQHCQTAERELRILLLKHGLYGKTGHDPSKIALM